VKNIFIALTLEMASGEQQNGERTPDEESAKSPVASGGDVANNTAKDVASGTSDAAGSSMNDLARQLRQLDVLTLNPRSAAKDMDEAKRRKFAFWETQPVPKFGSFVPSCVQAVERLNTRDRLQKSK
jgi:hypothetical protein